MAAAGDRLRLVVAALALLLPAASSAASDLAVHPTNPRWLTEDGGATATVLTGAHTWSIFQDHRGEPSFDAKRYLRGLAADGHNFTRGWFWEDGYYTPLPWARKGGSYRLTPPYRKAYLKRLRQRLRAAQRRGLYASVMLFQGWSVSDYGGRRVPSPWPLHPFNRANTAETVTRQGSELHIGPALSQQLEYVSYLARKLCSESNLIWEIANEAHRGSFLAVGGTTWHRQILNRVRSECPERLTWVSCPMTRGISVEEEVRLGETLLELGADLVAPCNPHGRGVADPPFANGVSVVVADSDHLGQVTFEWAWKAFLRGQHPVFMDLGQRLAWWNGAQWDADDPEWTRVRRALGAIQELVEEVDRERPGRVRSGLADMAPQDRSGGRNGDLVRPASSSWALFSSDRPCPQSGGVCILATANGDEVIAYAHGSQTVQICSLRPRKRYGYRWKRARGPGFVGSPKARRTDTEGCLRLENPASSVAILHLERVIG